MAKIKQKIKKAGIIFSTMAVLLESNLAEAKRNSAKELFNECLHTKLTFKINSVGRIFYNKLPYTPGMLFVFDGVGIDYDNDFVHFGSKINWYLTDNIDGPQYDIDIYYTLKPTFYMVESYSDACKIPPKYRLMNGLIPSMGFSIKTTRFVTYFKDDNEPYTVWDTYIVKTESNREIVSIKSFDFSVTYSLSSFFEPDEPNYDIVITTDIPITEERGKEDNRTEYKGKVSIRAYYNKTMVEIEYKIVRNDRVNVPKLSVNIGFIGLE